MQLVEIGDYRLSRDELQDLLVTDHPMVQQFRFEPTGRGAPDQLSFALHIIPRGGVRYLQQRDARGERVKPAWRTLSGQVEIGQGDRVIYREGDALVAENCTFFPHQEFNDLGIGSALYVSMERLYRHLGVRRVSLLAVDVGVYVWARQGFAFARRGATADLAPRLRRFVQEYAPALEIDSAQLGESWDLANFDAPGLRVDGERIGKAFMLQVAPPWPGVKLLGDPRHDDVAEASRRETFARLPARIDGAPDALAVR